MDNTDTYWPNEVLTYRWILNNKDRQWNSKEKQMAKEYLRHKRRYRDPSDTEWMRKLKTAKEIIKGKINGR